MCCVDNAVPTQVILKKNLTAKNVPSIAAKVAIQLNCKIGGAPWTVEIPLQVSKHEILCMENKVLKTFDILSILSYDILINFNRQNVHLLVYSAEALSGLLT